MAQNIESKVRVESARSVEAKIRQLGASFQKQSTQEDIYFETGNSKRLKLRTIDDSKIVLIAYERPNTDTAKTSDWRAVPFEEKEAIFDLLKFMYGVKVKVRKQRKFYSLKNTEIHLDDVEGLGSFIELETQVVHDRDSAVEEHNGILKDLGFKQADFVKVSYSDLLA